MQHYRFYFFGSGGHIKERREMLCIDDDDAQRQAVEIDHATVIEIWQGNRKVAAVRPVEKTRPDTNTPGSTRTLAA